MQNNKINLLILTIFATLALVLIGFNSASAWHAEGCMYCDDNQNGSIDIGVDRTLPGVIVDISNDDMSFSDYRTTRSDGCFSMTLPDIPDSYTATLDEATLPADPTFLLPNTENLHFYH